MGIDPVTMRPKIARGIVAIGNVAVGVLAIGDWPAVCSPWAGLHRACSRWAARRWDWAYQSECRRGSIAIGGAAWGSSMLQAPRLGPAVVDYRRCDEAARIVRRWAWCSPAGCR
jgi:hypothetical protein